jgi:signal transduction histidine kinase
MTPSGANIKIGLVAAAIVMVMGILWYTQGIVERLQDSERRVVAVFAKVIEYNTSVADPHVSDYTFFLTNILSVIDFPMIQSSASNEPQEPYSITTRNVVLDTTLAPLQQKEALRAMISSFDRRYPPIRIAYFDSTSRDTIVLNYIHYGDSPLIHTLQMLPYVEIAIGALFILVGYIGFSYIKRAEQSSIWAGMARETAHQLGTPLSSLMGWSELLGSRVEGNAGAEEALAEVREDITRLQKVTDRFSKIGSRPDRRKESLNAAVERVVRYLERRIPQMNKSVEIRFLAPDQVECLMNAELVEWVIENLLKNALDAIESNGRIDVSVMREGTRAVVEVHDTGKGIDPRLRKDVFRPGYSTKRRGWGLGLSLSKRIVEEFHDGKIFVKASTTGKGATFRVELEG